MAHSQDWALVPLLTGCSLLGDSVLSKWIPWTFSEQGDGVPRVFQQIQVEAGSKAS